MKKKRKKDNSDEVGDGEMNGQQDQELSIMTEFSLFRINLEEG